MRNTTKLSCLLLLSLPLLLLIASLLAYISPDQSMRICLPVSLQKISPGAHRAISCSYRQTTIGSLGTMPINTAATMETVNGGETAGRLAGFLESQKALFEDDYRKGDLSGWTVAMGNEAGDLDSLASSISFSYLSNALLAERAIPLVLTPPSLMQLRPENLFALQLASTPLSNLLHLSSLPSGPASLAQLGAKFALVDHNKLLPIFENGKVVAILDHHQDDGEHLDANPRTIQVPTGSCAALVAKHFAPQWLAAISGPAGHAGSPVPPEVATLLLSSILIDTGGLKTKEGSKTTPTDLEAASFLWPLSTLSNATEANFASEVPVALKDLTQKLLDTKSDVSRLSTHDLLIRDYKSYTLATSSVAFPVLKVGLSTVPMGLKTWLGRDGSGWDGLLDGTDAYMAEHDLDIEGILTTYRSDKGNHKRELVLVLSSGARRAITNDEQAEKIFNELVAGLEADPVLDLGEWKKKSLMKSLDKAKKGEVKVAEDTFVKDGRWGKVWSQRNTSATRKQLQPVLQALIAKLK